MNELPQQPDNGLDKLIEAELNSTLESFRWLATQLVQVATVLAVVNITVIGFGSSGKQAGMFVLGGLVCLILLIAYRGGMKGAVPLLCRMLELEKKVQHRFKTQQLTSIGLVLLNILGVEFLQDAKFFLDASDSMQQQRAMKMLEQRMFLRYPTRAGSLLLLGSIVVQILMAPVLVWVLNWTWF